MRKNFLSMLAIESEAIAPAVDVEIDTNAPVNIDVDSPESVIVNDADVTDVVVDTPADETEFAEVEGGAEDAAAFEVPEVSQDTELAAVDNVGADIQETIIAEGDDLVEAGEEIPHAEDAAEFAGDVADTFEDKITENDEGPEPLATAMAAEALSTMLKRYKIDFKPAVSRESFGTKNGRLQANRSVVKMAREAEASLKDKIKSVIARITTWLKEVWAQLTDKSARIAKKAEGLAARAKEAKLAGGETTVQVLGDATVQHLKDVTNTALDMVTAANSLGGEYIERQQTLTGYTYDVVRNGDTNKYSVEVTNSIETKDIKSLNSGQIAVLCSAIASSAKSYSSSVSRLNMLINSLKTNTVDEENMSSMASRVTTAQKLVSEANKLMYGSINSMFTVIEKSIAAGSSAKEAKGAADAAVKAATA